MAKFSLPELQAIVASVVTASNVSNATFNVTRNNTAELVDKIGAIVTLDSVFTIDKLARFDGQYMEFGKIIEEWYQDLLLPQDYDATGAGALTPADPTYRPCFYSYSIGRKKLKTTIRGNDLERAVNNAEEFNSLIAKTIKRVSDSYAQYRYGLKREALASIIDLCKEEMGQGTGTPATFAAATAYNTINTLLKDSNTPTAYGILVKKYASNAATNWADAVAKGYIVVLDLITSIAAPVDTSTSNAFIKQVKKDVEKAGDVSEGHSLNGNTIGAVEGITLILRQGVMPEMEVESYAGAFNRGDLAIPADIVVVKDFGSASSDFFAMILDNRAFRLHNTYNAQRDEFNGDGDFENIYQHTEDTIHVSRNAFVKVYKKP